MGMHVAGSSSWRLDTKGGYASELALFVRDACGLVVAGPGAAVPRLVGDVPDLSGPSTTDSRAAAGAQWSGWWQRLLDYEFRDRPQESGSPRDRARRRLAELHAVCDQPGFENLAGPELRSAARMSFASFSGWEALRPRPSPTEAELDWSLTKQVAEDVAFDHRVSIGDVRASVAILPVQGNWWARAAPGAVLCSTAAAEDPHTAQALLRDAFASGLVA